MESPSVVDDQSVVRVDHMELALDLADRALGRTSPNPAVGAVVVQRGEIVGRGFTQPPGSAHAEVVALAEAGARADGAELYVTLEPCCHHGRTPPCTEAIIAAGIRAVHVATLDPFPAVNGQGVKKLREAGVAVEIGEHAREAEVLNEAFFQAVRRGRPFVTAKWAMTLDGKIATRRKDSRWVTGSEARQLVHMERDVSDAIVVGVETVLADDPLLTVRLSSENGRRPARKAPPLRVVFDSRARTPVASNLVRLGVSDGHTLIAVTDRAAPNVVEQLRTAGADVRMFPSLNDGRVKIEAVLAELRRRGVNRVLLEGGGGLVGAFFQSRLIDRVLAFVAPKLIGGEDATSPIGGVGYDSMQDAVHLEDVTHRTVGQDFLIEGRLR